jgi:hypothetical protein
MSGVVAVHLTVIYQVPIAPVAGSHRCVRPRNGPNFAVAAITAITAVSTTAITTAAATRPCFSLIHRLYSKRVKLSQPTVSGAIAAAVR